jgi:Cu+-exporting ATPase
MQPSGTDTERPPTDPRHAASSATDSPLAMAAHDAHAGHHHHAAPTGHARTDAPPRPADGPVEYTCPMHPQVRQMGPGHCPICGMALEPVLASAEAGESPELRDMTRRFWIGLALSVPVVVLEMGAHVVDLHRLVAPQLSNWIQLLFGTPVVLWAGWPFFVRAAASVRHRSLNMFTLIALGTGVAWLYSIVGTVAPSLFPAEFRGMGGAVAV